MFSYPVGSGAARRCRAVDAWGLGCLVQEVFSGKYLQRTEDLRNLACIPAVRRPLTPCSLACLNTCCCAVAAASLSTQLRGRFRARFCLPSLLLALLPLLLAPLLPA